MIVFPTPYFFAKTRWGAGSALISETKDKLGEPRRMFLRRGFWGGGRLEGGGPFSVGA